MKKKQEIFDEYKKFSVSKPWIFGKDEHWNAHYEGYEAGYQDGVEESQTSFSRSVGMDLENFPTDVDKQFEVMRNALQEYYNKKR